jgi:hypothetical protein
LKVDQKSVNLSLVDMATIRKDRNEPVEKIGIQTAQRDLGMLLVAETKRFEL